MRFLRTISTRRLLALVAGLVIAVAGGTAIAVAAAGSGPVPASKRLAVAIHQALSAKSVSGLSANITFTNNLIGSSDVQGTDPLLTGATGRLWIAPGRARLELQSSSGTDAQAVFNRGSFWVYDPAANTVYRGHLPAGAMSGHRAAKANGKAKGLPTIGRIQTELNKLAAQLGISHAAPTDVAGRPAYRVAVSPKHNGGLLGKVQLAWDAVHGTPLDFSVYATGNSSPVLELQASSISYGGVPVSYFRIKPPGAAKTVKVNLPAEHTDKRSAATKRKVKPITGRAAVQRHLGFTLAAPASLAGKARHSVSLLGGRRDHGALVLYGRGLGGIAVIERPAGSGHPVLSSGAGQSGGNGSLTLPTVKINGVSAQQLQTPLGTVLQFTRGGVSYLVLGSVTARTADTAARGL